MVYGLGLHWLIGQSLIHGLCQLVIGARTRDEPNPFACWVCQVEVWEGFNLEVLFTLSLRHGLYGGWI